MSSSLMSAFLVAVVVSAFWIAPVESVDCKRLCDLSGAPRIGDCYCKIILFGSKRNADSPSNSETVLTCDELCERSGAPRIGGCFCRMELLGQKRAYPQDYLADDSY
ncbi:hypothetical protein CDAR_264001 [Caerostris darwini]|uniref:Uncharacterized protein n=1 Tax=Caerostris darwini TaxID=1538125 RepID=A0AAV4TQ37_9ARAC|nr:hypothetical protein CDAR_264001 [Caerostris darwini]